MNFDFENPLPKAFVLQNVERILNYMDDINIERKSKFEYTPAESFYILWEVEGLEFHIESLKNGLILYTFRNKAFGNVFGTETISKFIPRLESYLLAGMC
ncbi:hypothetical protein [Mucilaginibacter gotjawali]|nr:hypothetical protein [Mucilaginibacter gotjawali]MBB3055321.1 hypothetical protein [Mucilaginibacter gotjawali]